MAVPPANIRHALITSTCREEVRVGDFELPHTWHIRLCEGRTACIATAFWFFNIKVTSGTSLLPEDDAVCC
jgi:hypothetical protein